jgi:hypothetical protein
MPDLTGFLSFGLLEEFDQLVTDLQVRDEPGADKGFLSAELDLLQRPLPLIGRAPGLRPGAIGVCRPVE